MKLTIKRIYEKPEPSDGTRILVDRLWPRGISKKEAHLDDWWKELAPSNELRKQFHHDPEKWAEFKAHYQEELMRNDEALAKALVTINKSKVVTLLYGASDKKYNNAQALKEFLENNR